MTRKRLLKIMMGNGLSRNVASQRLNQYREKKIPYVVAYWDYSLDLRAKDLSEINREFKWLRYYAAKKTGIRVKSIKDLLPFAQMIVEGRIDCNG